MLQIEMVRGCPYSCAYCGWGNSLTKNVIRRSHDWRAEISYIVELDLAGRFIDANFGQWDEDLEIYKFIMDHFDTSKNFRLTAYQTPNRGKQSSVEDIMYYSVMMGERGKVSIQDADQVVLDTVDRKGRPWEEYKSLLVNLRNRLGPDNYRRVQAEFMLGLPKQSFDSVTKTIFRVLYEAGCNNQAWNHWQMIENSPAANPEFQKKYGLEFVKTYYPRASGAETDLSIDECYESIANGHGIDDYFTGSILYRTPTLDMVDIIAIRLIERSIWYAGFSVFGLDEIEARRRFNIVVSRAHSEASRIFADLAPRYAKYGFILSATKLGRKLFDSWVCNSSELVKIP